jgi:Haemolymph juvenile hormone binding protein (JHBP)
LIEFLKPVPDIAQSISMANLKMTNVNLFGISKFRIKYVTTEIKEMKAKMQIEFDSLVLKADYQLSSFMSRSKGPAVIVLKEVKVFGEADLGVERDGKLRTQSIVRINSYNLKCKNISLTP